MKHMFLLAIQGFIVLGACASFAQVTDPPATGSDSAPAGQSLKNAPAIKSKADALFTLISTDNAAGTSKLAKDKTFFDGYPKVQEECANDESRTTYVCLEKTSPQIAKYLPLIQAAISAMGAGVKDACSSFGKAMDLANKGLLAYQGACATTKMICQSSCGGAGKNLKASLQAYLKTAAETKGQLHLKYGSMPDETILENRIELYTNATKELKKEAEEDLDTGKERSVVAKNKTCTGYDNQLASALTGGVGVLASMGKANECDKKTTAANVAALAAAVDCTITANKTNNMTCICIDAPRTPGCAGGLDTALSAQNGGAMRTGDMAGYTPAAAKANIGMDDVAGGLGGGPVDGAAGTSGPGAPISGGKGVDGGSGGSGGGPSQANAKSGSGLNTNILGGEGGGGGGGYGSGGSDGNGLRQFLPKRDPAGNKLAGSALSAGVTAPGGKSNWEKVKERYRDNNTTLLGK